MPSPTIPITDEQMRARVAFIASELVRSRSKRRRPIIPVVVLITGDGREVTLRLDGVPPGAWGDIMTEASADLGAQWVVLAWEGTLKADATALVRSSLPPLRADAPDRMTAIFVGVQRRDFATSWIAEIHPDGTVDAPVENAALFTGGRLYNPTTFHN